MIHEPALLSHARLGAGLVLSAALLLGSVAPGAAGGPGSTGFRGATVDLSYGNLFGYDYSAVAGVGSASFALGGGLVVQGDLGLMRYTASPSYRYLAAHLGYELGNGVTVGAFYARDFVNSGSFDVTYGLEFVAEAGAFGSLPGARIEGHYARHDGFANVFDLDFLFPVMSAVELSVGLNHANWGGAARNTASLGLRYNAGNGAFLHGSVHQMQYVGHSDTMIRIGGGFNFGQGATFGTRRYFDWFPGY